MWDKLRNFKSRRSSRSSREDSRSSSPAAPAPENRRGRNSDAVDIFQKIAQRPAAHNVVPASNRSLNIASSRSRERSQDRRADPLGLNVLYIPELPPSVDIIFIHGLGGSSHQTWSKGRDPELFWPKKWLPSEFDICTSRIFSFGYNANFSSSSSTSISNLSDFAKSLLFSMRFGKDENGQDLDIGRRPIIFVTHSMGGLVFKKAYIQGQGNSDYQSAIDQICGIIFLSTPHRGTHLAEILNRILTVSIFNHTPKKYLAELNRNSSAIEDLNESFRNYSSRLRIFSFYETLQTLVGPKNMIVLDKDSSILGYPGEVSQPLDANHHDVCKFSSVNDPNYISVRSALQTLVSTYCESRNRAHNTVAIAIDQSVAALLGVSTAPFEDLVSLQNRWAPGTCEGILLDPIYRQWKDSLLISNLLWINAQPGSGKSILASFLITHFKESAAKCSFYFFKHDDSTKRSASSLLRSLAFQIAHDIPLFKKALNEIEGNGLRLEKLDPRLIWQKLFVSVLFKLEYTCPLYWIIDALDESDSIDVIIDLFSRVSDSRTPIHIMILSRSIYSITKALDRISNTMPVSTMSLDQRVGDIRVYTVRKIEHMHGDAELRKQVSNQVVERAEGNFLWASLVIREILECHSYDEIQTAMEMLPSGMDSLFQRMEATISGLPKPSDKILARHILIWATYSRRPLHIDELVQALEPRISAVLDLKFTISKICGHFVAIDSNDHVSLVHRTAREYLIKSSNLPFSIASHDAHKELFTRTLSIYFNRQLRSQLNESSLPLFYSYSATSWAYHLNLSPADSEDIFNMLVKFFQGPYVQPWIQFLALLGQLKVLLFTSQSLTSFIRRRRKIDATKSPLLHRLSDLQSLELWTIDLLKIVGKFGGHLLQEPSSIYKGIPQFSPRNSAVFQQFSKSANTPISVSGLTNLEWDDCLARVSVGNEHQALMVISSGRYLAVLSSNGMIHIWNSLTFEALSVLSHQEHIFIICFSENGDRLASYGYSTTRVWELSTGRQLYKVSNPADSRALCMSFADNDTTVVMGSELRNIRKLHLDELENKWQVARISMASEESTLKGTFSNIPTAMAFDPDVVKVAIAYRGSPMTVWALENPRCINKCKRRLGSDSNSSLSWTGVSRVVWHPNSGEVLGIYTDGAVFKWHPFDESHSELKADLRSAPSEIQCSRDGVVFATSDVNGTIRLYNYEHFVLVYQLSSEDVVTDLCFSPDTRRFYDLRGSYCNAWEPNSLLRTLDIDDGLADSDTEVGSTATSFLASEAWVENHAPITALSARCDGLAVCAGNDEGDVILYDISNDKKFVVGKSATEMSIDHLIWAEDGKSFVYAELGKSIVMKSLLKDDNEKDRWNFETVVNFKSSLENEIPTQILLSPNSNFLLTVSSSSARLCCTKTKSILAAHKGSSSEAGQRWVTHPKEHDQVLAFAQDSITAYSWSNLEQLDRWKMYFPELSDVSYAEAVNMPGLPRKNSSGEAITHFEADSRIEQVFAARTSDYILIHVSQQLPNLSQRSHVQIIKASSLSKAPDGTTEPLIPVPIPPELSHSFEKSLGILDKDLLVFLDKSFWVCTHQIKENSQGHHAQYRRHFFLPRDWINAESLALCQALPDGTIVCPRKGELAIIRSDLASGW